MTQFFTLANILQTITIPDNIQPLNVTLPPPPKLEGRLAPNTLLSEVQVRADGRVLGPESMVVKNGNVYTGQGDGWVVEVSPQGTVTRIARLPSNTCGGRQGPACGRPMGIRLSSKGLLVVADAYNGIFDINPVTGKVRHLVDTRSLLVNGRPVGYVNDLALTPDGTVFFTSSSSKWTLAKESNILFEADNTGRVLVYNGEQVGELITSLTFPNGLQLSPDNDYLLVAEGARSRILRAWLGPTSAKRNTLEVFSANLPGVVDNVRLSPRGTFWVGMSQARHHGLPNVLDQYGHNPRLRALIIMMVNNNMTFQTPPLGMVVEVDGDGRVVRTLQDPQGRRFSSVSEVQEENGVLYFASPANNSLGFVPLSWLRPDSNERSILKHRLVVDFLHDVRTNMLRTTDGRLKRAMVQLIEETLLDGQRLSQANALIARHQQTLQRLRRILQQPHHSKGAANNGGGAAAETTTVRVVPS